MLFASKNHGQYLFNKRQKMIDKGQTTLKDNLKGQTAFSFSPTTDFKLGTFQDHFECILQTDNLHKDGKKITLTQVTKKKKQQWSALHYAKLSGLQFGR